MTDQCMHYLIPTVLVVKLVQYALWYALLYSPESTGTVLAVVRVVYLLYLVPIFRL